MSEAEVSELLHGANKLQLGTINPDGTPHMVTMFYAMVDDRIAFWTYGRSQKARNLERDPRVTCLVELGDDYFELRGALLYGTTRAVTDPEDIRRVGRAVVQRMYPDVADAAALEPFVEGNAAKRWAYYVDLTKVASWDHRKLGG
ncbi:PPOX class F420-dependent oxidoreductase [Actinocorallia lasiicapitis]